MSDPMSPARRRAEAAFALLSHAAPPLHRAVDDAQSVTDERTLKTQRLRNARLERERYAHPVLAAVKSAKRKPLVITK